MTDKDGLYSCDLGEREKPSSLKCLWIPFSIYNCINFIIGICGLPRAAWIEVE